MNNVVIFQISSFLFCLMQSTNVEAIGKLYHSVVQDLTGLFSFVDYRVLQSSHIHGVFCSFLLSLLARHYLQRH